MEHTGLKVATFQDRFTELAGENEQTVTALAKELHVSRQTVSAWISGDRSPKEPTIIAISNYFNVEPRWLMGFDVDRLPKHLSIEYVGYSVQFHPEAGSTTVGSHPTPEDYEMAELWSRAYPQAKRAAIAVLKALEAKV